MADYIHDLRKMIGPGKIILNAAGGLIMTEAATNRLASHYRDL